MATLMRPRPTIARAPAPAGWIPTPLDAQVWAARFLAARTDFAAFLYFCAIEDIEGGTERLPWLEPGTERTQQLERGAIRFRRWSYLVERARSWGRGTNEITVKGRQLGFTWLAVCYALFVARRAGGRVLVISKGQLEAYAFLDRVRFVLDRLPLELRPPEVKTDNQGELRFRHGGEIIALPSTQGAGRSFTGRLLILDENAFHGWAAQNWRAVRPAVADKGQTIVMSTANGASGHFHDLYQGAKKTQGEIATIERDIERARRLAEDTQDTAEVDRLERLLAGLRRAALVPVFTSALARSDRSQEWLDIERRLFVGLGDEFSSEYPTSEAEAFVQLRGLVFPSFTVETHVRATHPVAWEQCLYRFGSYDLGGGDPTAAGVLGVYRDTGGTLRMHKYGEFYRDSGSPIPADIAQFFVDWHARAPLTRIYPDHRDSLVANELRSVFGLPVAPVDMRIWERGEGLGIVDTWLRSATLTFHESCYNTIRQAGQYRWAERVDPNDKQRYKTKTPHDHHADTWDVTRGMVVGAWLEMLQELPNATSRRMTVID